MKRHWNAVMAMLGVCAAVATVEAGILNKPPRPLPKYTVEVIYGVWCPVVEYEPISGFAVNSHGDVAGHLTACDQDHEAFIYSAGGGPLFVMPHAPTVHEVYGADLNDAGWLVGRIGQGGYKGFVYKPDGSLTLIPPPTPPGNWCEATGVNNAGVVVGFWKNVISGPTQAYRWENGIRADLVELRGPESEAYDVSESGLITGWTGIHPIIDSNAFVWDNAKVTLLPCVPGGISSQGYAVNDRGDVCGRGRVNMTDGGWKWRAFASIDGEMIAIPPLPGWTDHTSALGINSHGQVVGGSGFGYLWQDHVIIALNELLIDPPPALYISGAKAISDDGRIVAGCGFNTSGDALTCLLTPVASDPADLSGDGIVNGFDLALLLGDWGCCIAPCSADLDGSGCVNGFDLAILLASWTS